MSPSFSGSTDGLVAARPQPRLLQLTRVRGDAKLAASGLHPAEAGVESVALMGATVATPPLTRVHVGRIVVHGLTPDQQRQLAATLRSELEARLMVLGDPHALLAEGVENPRALSAPLYTGTATEISTRIVKLVARAARGAVR